MSSQASVALEGGASKSAGWLIAETLDSVSISETHLGLEAKNGLDVYKDDNVVFEAVFRWGRGMSFVPT